MFLKNITKELREVSSELKSLNGKLDKLIEVQSNKDHSYEKELILAVTRVTEAVNESTLSTSRQFSKLVDLKDEIMGVLFADEDNKDYLLEEEAHRQLAEELSNLLGDDRSTEDDTDTRSTPTDESSELPDHDLLDLPDETDLRQFAEPLLNDGFVTPLLDDFSDRDVDEEDIDEEDVDEEDIDEEDVDEEDIDEEEDPEDDDLSSEDNSDSTYTVSLSTLYYYVDQIPDLVHTIYPDKTGSDFSIFLEALEKVDLGPLGDYIERAENNFTAMSDFYEIRHTNIFKDTARKVTAEMVKALKPETEAPEAPYTILPVQEAIEDFFLMAVKFLNCILIDRSQAVNTYRLSNEVLRSYVS